MSLSRAMAREEITAPQVRSDRPEEMLRLEETDATDVALTAAGVRAEVHLVVPRAVLVAMVVMTTAREQVASLEQVAQGLEALGLVVQAQTFAIARCAPAAQVARMA